MATQPITLDYLNRILPVVADSWAQLRQSDVYRLLLNFAGDLAALSQACQIVFEQRSDLRDEIADAAVDIAGVNQQAEPITLIRHVMGAEVYRDAKGIEWYCRPNGDLVFNLSLRVVPGKKVEVRQPAQITGIDREIKCGHCTLTALLNDGGSQE